jgi:hypothetical protein
MNPFPGAQQTDRDATTASQERMHQKQDHISKRHEKLKKKE